MIQIYLTQCFLTGAGHASPGAVNKFKEGASPLRALKHGTLLIGKVFRPLY